MLALTVGTDSVRKKSELWRRLEDPSQNTEENRSALRSCLPNQHPACGKRAFSRDQRAGGPGSQLLAATADNRQRMGTATLDLCKLRAGVRGGKSAVGSWGNP